MCFPFSDSVATWLVKVLEHWSLLRKFFQKTNIKILRLALGILTRVLGGSVGWPGTVAVFRWVWACG